MVGRFKRKFQTCSVIGLGFGDEGKGMAVAHETARAVHDGLTPVNVRFNGGPQAAHNVRIVTDEGHVLHHTHSQLGSGTMLGAITVITDGMLFDPFSMGPEALHMARITGRTLSQVIGNVHVDELCPVVLPIHAAVNRALEEDRGDARHGSTGSGIGVARACEDAGDDVCVRVCDLLIEDELSDKLECVISWLERRFDVRIDADDVYAMASNASIELYELLDAGMQTYRRGSPIHRMLQDGRHGIVFEGSQGMLLDERYGWFPHVTYGDMTDAKVRDLLDGTGVAHRTIGVTRSYQTRHGAGPMPSEGTAHIEDVDNGESEWAGKMRSGLLDVQTMSEVAEAIWPDMVYVSNMDRYPGAWVSTWNDCVEHEGCHVLVPTAPAIERGDERALVKAIECGCNTRVGAIGRGPTLDRWEDVP